MCVNVSIEDDNAFEYSENFTATLTTSDPNVIINPPMATVEIRDTDGEGIAYAVKYILEWLQGVGFQILYWTYL